MINTVATTRRRWQAGFTLFELMVVLAIIGIIITAATLSLGGDRRGEELARESQRFAALLKLASEQAVLRSEEWAVQVEPDSYRFLVLVDDKWQAIDNDNLFRARNLEDGTQLSVELEGRKLVLDVSDKLKPTILLLSSGEVSAFVADFSAQYTVSKFRVKSDLMGDIQWQRVES